MFNKLYMFLIFISRFVFNFFFQTSIQIFLPIIAVVSGFSYMSLIFFLCYHFHCLGPLLCIGILLFTIEIHSIINFKTMDYKTTCLSFQEKCPICWENGYMIQLPCKHFVHATCIQKWKKQSMNYNNHCPLCRKEIS